MACLGAIGSDANDGASRTVASLLPHALRSIRPSCGTATCARAWWSPSSGGKKMRWRAHCDRSTERNRAGTRSSLARMVATPAMPSSTPNSTSFWSPAESHNATCGISTLRLGVRPMQAKFDSRSCQRSLVPCGVGVVRDVPKRGPIPLSRLRAIACAAWRGALPCRPFNRFQPPGLKFAFRKGSSNVFTTIEWVFVLCPTTESCKEKLK